MTEMRVWIGCLACRNDGYMTGGWYPAIGAGEVTSEQVHDDDAQSPIPGALAKITHEELCVVDHEGFAGLLTGECSPMTADEIASLVDDLDDDRREAFGHYIKYTGTTDVDHMAMVNFNDAYRGFWDSEREFAMNDADDAESTLKHALAAYEVGPYGKPRPAADVDIPWPFNCIDWDMATDELFNGDYWSARGNGGVHVFWAHG